MKLSIWKYPVPDTGGVFSLPLPERAAVLDVQVQGGIPVIWALVDTEAQTAPRFFVLYGTGHPVETREMRYHGTFQLQDGLVFHLFERP